jgi:hypothetical protein
MAATTYVHVFNGAGPSATDITSTEIRFKRADNNTVDALTPVPIPAASEVFSWRKSTKLYIATSPSAYIRNLRFFSSGTALGTGITHYVVASASYVQGSSSDETSKIGSGIDSTTYTSGSPLTINAGDVILTGGSIPGYGTQDYLVQQIGVASTASAGVSGTRTYTLRYDEA